MGLPFPSSFSSLFPSKALVALPQQLPRGTAQLLSTGCQCPAPALPQPEATDAMGRVFWTGEAALHQQLNPLPPVLPMLLGMQPRTRVLSGPVQGDVSSDTYPHLSAQQSCIYRVCIGSSIGSLRSWPGSNTAEGSWNPLLGPLLQLLSCPKSSFLVPPGCDRLQGGRAE